MKQILRLNHDDVPFAAQLWRFSCKEKGTTTAVLQLKCSHTSKYGYIVNRCSNIEVRLCIWFISGVEKSLQKQCPVKHCHYVLWR